MSIRLRTVDGSFGRCRVAVCAAETDPAPGDVYLDDADHHALATKFAIDHASETGGEPFGADHVLAAAMATQKLRDAEEELLAWIAAGMPPPEEPA